jgi:hypothetical protein
MSNFLNNNIGLLNILLNTYERVMHLKLFVDSNDNKLINMYQDAANKHNNKLYNSQTHIDAGFDLFAPGSEEAMEERIGLMVAPKVMQAISSNLYNKILKPYKETQQ